MQDCSISMKDLLTETLRRLPPSLILVALIAIVHAIVYLSVGNSRVLAVVFASFFTFLYFSAPFAASAVRAKRGFRLFTCAGGKTLLFCFLWGSLVIGLSVATLQLWQGMAATALNYFVSMAVAGLVCAAAATIPNRH